MRRPPLVDHQAAPTYQALGWVMVRAPLLPVEQYPNHDSSGVGLLLADPAVRWALLTASGTLLEALDRQAQVTPRRAERLQASLLRYLIRLSTRPTPFGLCAGVAIAAIGTETTLSIDGLDRRTATRPDAAWLGSFVRDLEGRPQIKANLRFTSNPSIRLVGNRAVLETGRPAGDERTRVSVNATAGVRYAIERCKSPTPYAALASGLSDNVRGATPARVGDLIDRLIGHGFLVSDLRPASNHPRPAAAVLERLRANSAADAEASRLATLLADMADLDRHSCDDRTRRGDQSKRYRNIGTRLRDLHQSPDSTSLVHIDSALPIRGHVGTAIAAAAAEAADVLLRLTPAPWGAAELAQYRTAIVDRWGAHADIPLLDVMDAPDVLELGESSWTRPDANGLRMRRRNQALLELAGAANRAGVLAVELDEAILTRLQLWEPDISRFPPTLEIKLAVAAQASPTLAVDSCMYVVAPNPGIAPAGRHLGRFTDLLGPAAVRALREAAAIERGFHPGAMLAEIAFVARSARAENVVVHCHPHQYEVLVDGNPNVPPDRVIPLNELVVAVRAGRLYLVWPRVRRRILCTSGHMLNPRLAPPVVRFLETMRAEDSAVLAPFGWGPAAGLPVLPRVQRGNLVLAPARWRLTTTLLANEALSDTAHHGQQSQIAAWRERWNVARHVYLGGGDRRLLLDLEATSHVDLLLAELARTPEGGLGIEEAVPGPEHAWLPGPDGSYLSELVVPVARSDAVETRFDDPATLVSAAPGCSAGSVVAPGGDWLYLRLYCVTAVADDLISGPVLDFCDYLVGAGLSDKWFYLRYADPDCHLRVRIHGDRTRLTHEVLPRTIEWAHRLVDDRFLVRFSVDTYEREVARYGGEAGVELAEGIFAIDSQAVAEMLAIGFDPSTRSEIAARTVDDLLIGLGLNNSHRTDWYRRHATRTASGGKEYRARSERLRPLFAQRTATAPVTGLDAVLDSRIRALKSIGVYLGTLQADNGLTRKSDELCRAYVHMHCNRMGVEPTNETLVLELAHRTSESLRLAPRVVA